MQFIFVYENQPLPQWIDLLKKLENGKVEIIKLKKGESIDFDLKPTAIFFELYLNCEKFFKLLKEKFSQTLYFSFSSKKELHLKEKSSQMGFVFHLEEEITYKELVLHLFYSEQISQQKHKYLLERTRLINETTKFHQFLDKQLVLKSVTKTIPQLITLDAAALFLTSEDGKFLELITNLNIKEPITLIKLTGQQSNNLIAKVAKSGKPVLINKENDELKEPHFQKNKFNSVMYLPLATQSKTFGVLEMARIYGEPFSNIDLVYAEELVLGLSVALFNSINFAQVEHLGRIDDLTKLYNPRHLYQILEMEIKRARRYKAPLSLIFFDLDGFKAVNDNNGHLCGSAILVEVANLIIRLVRDTDVVARYGGDEFVIVLPGTPAEQAVIIAERIRQSIEAHVFQNSNQYKEIYLTASFGVACYPEHASLPTDLIRCADKAMYLAKELNKNQVVLAS